MTKYEWEKELRNNLKRLPESEVARVVDYYNELFEDKVEEGLSEREIVKRFGNPFDVAYKILYDSGADANNEGRIKAPEPFMPYERTSAGGATRAAGGHHDVDRRYEPVQTTDSGAQESNKGQSSAFIEVLVTRLVFFVPFIICASVLWSLVVGFIVGGVGAILAGVIAAFTGFFYIGSGVFMAVMGMGLAAAGVGIVLSAGGVLLLKTAIRLTQKYFYMSKHRVNASIKNKERMAS